MCQMDCKSTHPSICWSEGEFVNMDCVNSCFEIEGTHPDGHSARCLSGETLQSLKQAGNFIQNQKLPPPFWFKMELNVYAVLYWVCDELVQDGIIRANV